MTETNKFDDLMVKCYDWTKIRTTEQELSLITTQHSGWKSVEQRGATGSPMKRKG